MTADAALAEVESLEAAWKADGVRCDAVTSFRLRLGKLTLTWGEDACERPAAWSVRVECECGLTVFPLCDRHRKDANGRLCATCMTRLTVLEWFPL